MKIINITSLNMNNIPLNRKIKEIVTRLRNGEIYQGYVLKMDGSMLQIELKNNRRRVKQLKSNEYSLNY